MSNPDLRTKFKQVTFKGGVFDPRLVGRMKDEIDRATIIGFVSFKDKVCALALGLYVRPLCKCGKVTALMSTIKGYRKFCSSKCSASSAETMTKRKTTCLETFGVENAASASAVKTKIKNTNIERYGTPASISAICVRAKIKDVVQHKYGVDNVMHNAEIVSKIVSSYAGKSDTAKAEIKTRRRDTVISKFGCEHTLQDRRIRDAIKKTNIAKYGHSVPALGLLKNKAEQSRRSTYIKKYFNQRFSDCIAAGLIPVDWGIDEYVDASKDYKFFHESCGKEFFGKFKNSTIPRCPECQKSGSAIEHKLFEDLKKHFPTATQHDRAKIKPREIDILIEDVGIEINGVYWHRDELKKPILEKTLAFNGTLIHLWDFELINKYDICLSLILSKLGRFEQRHYARNCVLKKVQHSEAKNFFEKNHLRGNAAFSECYGLYHSDELIQAISISKSRYSKKADLELIRFASKLNTQVIGGLSRLIKALKKEHGGKVLLTYADRRYSKPDAYSSVFTFSHTTPPNYFWFKGNWFLSRQQTQRHKLPKLFDDVKPEDTERSVMQRHGYFKVSDCGNNVLVTRL